MKPFSASQISTAEDCLRKWAWDKLDGLSRGGNKYAQLGTMVHTMLEAWLKYGTPPPVDSEEEDIAKAAAVASKMIPKLPVPQRVDEDNVEGYFKVEIDGIPFRGFIDLAFHDYDIPEVWDHKTTTDFRWMKTDEDLVEDVQATLYAKYSMARSGKDKARLNWTYGKTTKSYSCKQTSVVVTEEEIEPRVQKTLETARHLQLIRESGVSAEEVPYDASACEKYGGCAYKENCNLRPSEQIKSIMSQAKTKNAFLAKLEARKAGKAAPAAKEEKKTKVATKAKVEDPVNPPETEPEVTEEAPPKATKTTKTTTKTTTKATTKTKASTPKKGEVVEWDMTLFVNCRPVNDEDVVDASEIIAAVNDALGEEKGIAHYRLAEYGEGLGYLHVGVVSWLRENQPSKVVVSTQSQAERDALQPLKEAASRMVVGQ